MRQIGTADGVNQTGCEEPILHHHRKPDPFACSYEAAQGKASQRHSNNGSLLSVIAPFRYECGAPQARFEGGGEIGKLEPTSFLRLSIKQLWLTRTKRWQVVVFRRNTQNEKTYYYPKYRVAIKYQPLSAIMIFKTGGAQMIIDESSIMHVNGSDIN
jgi:hypothetical protein